MNVNVTTLSNGLRVVTDVMPHVETVTVGVWTDVGSRHETAAQNGLSHMLEHMAFKGTQKRSAKDIAEVVEDVGGYMNAYTSREHTTYYARLLKEDLALGVDVLADILQNSVFDPQELERERGVIIQEIGQSNDTPDDIVFDYLQEASYPDQPIGRPILGTTELVKGFRREELATYMADHYKAEQMVVAVSGNFDHAELIKHVEDQFSDLEHTRQIPKEGAAYHGGSYLRDRKLEQVNLLLGFNGISFDDPDFYTAQIMSMILGGGMSSRLFQEVRETRGLVYSIYSFMQSYLDGGSFAIHAGTGPEQVRELIPVVAEEMHKMSHHVGTEEVNRARAQMKAGLLMSLESTTNRMEQLGRQMMIFGKPISHEDIVEKIDQVDATAIMRFTDRLLNDNKLSLAAVGPLGHLEDYDKIAALF
ncbi:peptidase M16 [Paremcibacter congregatus]|uniref:Peptidase M16 n=1 Tax=Paremcibacter congregatus TaxID=2043170 RepID=A0A2G4YTJ9_9PROT|nr:pitrilysin family protein [Paremcibacter congregatus]PHZ85623.1 peptidase M16 [Paremcibacter congregatus]QDE26583.1 insulinase family protein [Paremcibacter congregatus]